MRKQFKKALSMILSAAMVLTLGSGLELKSAKADEAATKTFRAEMAFADGSWGVQYWGEDSETVSCAAATVDGEGTYTVSLTKTTSEAAVGAQVFCIDILDMIPCFDADALQVSDVTVKADGQDVAVDADKVKFGNLEDNNDKFRIELYNEYGSTKEDAPIDKDALSWTSSLEVSFKLSNFVARPVVDEELWSTPGIHAFLSYQMDGTWDYRNGYEVGKKFKDGTSYEFIKDGANGEGAKAGSGVIAKDVLLTKDGEYTVAVNGIDLSAASKYNMLQISTDLDSEAYAGLEVTDAKLTVDGKDVETDLSLVKKVDNKYYIMSAVNTYAKDGEAVPPLNEKAANEEIAVPEKSIAITFKVAGLKKALQDLKDGNYVSPETGEKVKADYITDEDIAASTDKSEGGTTPGGPTPTPGGTTPGGNTPASPSPSANTTVSPSPTPAADATVGLAKGKSFTAGNFKYKVTAVATKAKAGKVTVTGLTKKGKKAKKLSVATAKNSGASYNVTAVGKNAFKGAKATQVTLGKNITKIPAGAFANCKSLKKLTLKGKLKSAAKKAFKGCKKTITVAGGSKKVKKANVKALKKSGYKKFK